MRAIVPFGATTITRSAGENRFSVAEYRAWALRTGSKYPSHQEPSGARVAFSATAYALSVNAVKSIVDSAAVRARSSPCDDPFTWSRGNVARYRAAARPASARRISIVPFANSRHVHQVWGFCVGTIAAPGFAGSTAVFVISRQAPDARTATRRTAIRRGGGFGGASVHRGRTDNGAQRPRGGRATEWKQASWERARQ